MRDKTTMRALNTMSFTWWTCINLFLISFCYNNVVSIAANGIASERTYGSWAKVMVPDQLSQLSTTIQPFLTEDFIPSKDERCKDLRTQVEYARNMFDIFAYAYPRGKGKTNDQWHKTRKQLNLLHKTVGHYKDMDKDTGETEMKEKFGEMKKQLVTYNTDITSTSVKEYFANPKNQQYQYRKRKHLSKMIWKEQPTNLPTLDYTGLGNVEMIFQGLVKDVISNWNRVKDYTPEDFLANETNLDTYHYVRKKLRIVDFMYQKFSLFLFENLNSCEKIMEDIVRPFISHKEIGQVKSDYEKYWKAHKKGREEKANRFKERGEKDLKALNQKFQQQKIEEDIVYNLHTLIHSLSRNSLASVPLPTGPVHYQDPPLQFQIVSMFPSPFATIHLTATQNLNGQLYPIDDFYNKEKTNGDTWVAAKPFHIWYSIDTAD